ncbi:MAG: flagellar hook assembly protein FlgD [Parvularcula sp.]|jgi:flagellar basal-body rod modification protein FlgD|nr:flagellar hook assembly protein FlgD [Parvularcula sp.]
MTDIAPISTERSAAPETAARASIARKALTDDMDTFLKLLTQQLQYQDPLEPMDTNQFVDQLTQFSELEQGVEQNATLNKIAAAVGGGDRQADLSYLGRVVEAQTENVSLSPAGARFAYDITSPSEKAELRIFDGSDRLVAQQEVSGSVGRRDFVWDGTMETGGRAPDGVYRVQIVAVGKGEEARLAGSILSGGRVSELRYNGNKTELLLDGGLVIDPADVRRVSVIDPVV